MWPAVAWDGDAVGWTVMHRLRMRQTRLQGEAEEARKKIARHPERLVEMLTAVSEPRNFPEFPTAAWHGETIVLAFLFAHPDSQAIHQLNARLDYFDRRTGSTWDLFFPGYYHLGPHDEWLLRNGRLVTDGKTVQRLDGGPFLYFSARGFDDLRARIEASSEGRWKYSGEVDLVLMTCWLPEEGEPTIDWESTIAGRLTDPTSGLMTLTLAQAVELISGDLEGAGDDSSFGVEGIRGRRVGPSDGAATDFVVNALAGIAAALGARVLGI